MMSSPEANISSAEMTAYWRSLFPQFSRDELSIKLASDAGVVKAREFERKFDYSLVGRKVSVRAGFILENSLKLLATGKYDSCISLASGFSLLTYCLACGTSKMATDTRYYDLDLPHMAEERAKRIHALPAGTLSEDLTRKIQIVSQDLEAAYREGITFRHLFPGCERPLFIIEGIIYFLTEACVNWLIEQISNYENAAVIFDYWPADGTAQSDCFKRVVDSLKGFIPESIKSFWDEKSIEGLATRFRHLEDHQLGRIENVMFRERGEDPQFNNQHAFFPVRFIVAEKTVDISLK